MNASTNAPDAATIVSTQNGDELPEMSGGTVPYIRSYFDTLKILIDAIDEGEVAEIVELLHDAYTNDKRLIMCGNGGSGSTSSHMVCDFQKNILLDGGKPFEAIALTDSPALVLAWGNDTSFENVFAGQARTWIRPGDLFVAISGSGNSPNILRVVALANELGAVTIGLCGYGGGKLAQLAQKSLVIRKRNMQMVEDLHVVLCHVLFSALRDRIKGHLTK